MTTTIMGYTMEEWQDMAALFEFENDAQAKTVWDVMKNWEGYDTRTPRSVWRTATTISAALAKSDGIWIIPMIQQFLIGSQGDVPNPVEAKK